jgi:hypothetical protein
MTTNPHDRYPVLVYDALMIVCSKCRREDARGVVVFTSSGPVEYCHYCNPRVFRDVAKNVFGGGLTLDHVRTEDGKPITVHSTKELRAAEKRNNFALAIMSDNDITKPPQHEPWAGDITHGYKRKWELDPDKYKPENITGVSAGVAKSAKDTLVDHPRPLK